MSSSKTMYAAVRHGGEVRLEERPVPGIADSRDAILRVTRASICTSDLHILHGAVPRARDGIVLGHEFTGEVVEVGNQVKSVRIGDRVAANVETFCGECFYCRRGFVNNCVSGGWELGCRIDGGHAEYVRVPYADNGLTPIPDAVSDEDALFVGDVLSSGFFGAELAAIRAGDSVAVLGAGPVGLCAMMCAGLFGPARIIALDKDAHRLRIARESGLADVAVNILDGDAVERVRMETSGRGADAVIEAAGGDDSFELAWQAARPNACVAVVAMYEKPQILPLNLMYGKNLTFKTGGVDANRCDELMRLIACGRLNTGMLITHRHALNDIELGYAEFRQREGNGLKWAITPYER